MRKYFVLQFSQNICIFIYFYIIFMDSCLDLESSCAEGDIRTYSFFVNENILVDV